MATDDVTDTQWLRTFILVPFCHIFEPQSMLFSLQTKQNTCETISFLESPPVKGNVHAFCFRPTKKLFLDRSILEKINSGPARALTTKKEKKKKLGPKIN